MIPWQPRYTLTPAIARRLVEIEAARGTELTEELIQRIHALAPAEGGSTSYRQLIGNSTAIPDANS